LLITPRALAAADEYDDPSPSGTEEPDDPLLELLRSHESMGQEEFLQALREQRNSEEVASS
jgi:hypothetical protein